MKNIFLFLSLILLSACGKNIATETSQIHALTAAGLGESIGTITVTELGKGIVIVVNATNLPAGEHGFHVHETNTLTPSTNDSGVVTIGGAAKGHWDPDKTGLHEGPEGKGHRGDLYKLVVPSSGIAQVTQTNTRINIKDIPGKSFMIHTLGDNYSDNPTSLGGGGGRMFASPF